MVSEVVFIFLEVIVYDVLNSGIVVVFLVVGYKFGKDVGELIVLIGGLVKNVVVVYIDVVGMGWKVIFKFIVKGIIKIRL